MKKILALSLVGAVLFTGALPAASAMSMSASSSTKMMMHADLNRLPVSQVAQKLGYNWSKDRMMFAKMAGITNYRGTAMQNIAIKKYLISLHKDGVTVGGEKMIRTRDIVDNAMRASNVTTVVAAVKAAGLVDTLKSEGPFTVFAPTNAAFAKLPDGTVDNLLKMENKEMLTSILTYHVVPGRYKASDLTDGLMLKTVQGETLKFTRMNGQLMINGSAMVETADVISTNGVTHVIDTVLMP